MTDIRNKTVWITGASSGIGAALAKTASEAGANVILSGRRLEALDEVARSLVGPNLTLPFEATDYPALGTVVEQAWNWQGQVDVLINNAGISQRSIAIETTPEVYQHLLDVDLLAPIWLTQLQLGRMAAVGGGHIVAISSVAGRIGAPMRTAYSAAKHGLIGYMDALRCEVETLHNIHVTNILPGSVATNVSRNALTADGSKRLRSDDIIDAGDDPLDCARAILDAIKTNTNELIYAKDNELELAKLRHADPDTFFEAIAGYGAQTVLALQQENS
jgi:dehydrogenase/reductase SDR family protein 7B